MNLNALERRVAELEELISPVARITFVTRDLDHGLLVHLNDGRELSGREAALALEAAGQAGELPDTGGVWGIVGVRSDIILGRVPDPHLTTPNARADTDHAGDITPTPTSPPQPVEDEQVDDAPDGLDDAAKILTRARELASQPATPTKR